MAGKFPDTKLILILGTRFFTLSAAAHNALENLSQ
jgi:hypothetical protein